MSTFASTFFWNAMTRNTVDRMITTTAFGPNRLVRGYETGCHTLPGVILIQEWWGITDIVTYQACLISSQGYRVLVPDLYRGVVGVDKEEACHLMMSLDYHRAVQEIDWAAKHLLHTGSPKVAVTGGCMGGALTFAAAQHVSELTAAAAFYGTPAREMPWVQVEKIKIPIEYHTGMLDHIQGFSDPQTALDIRDRMKAAGCNITVHLYPNTPHSFLNALAPGGVQFLQQWGYGVPPTEQVQLAFARLIRFLDKHLKAESSSTAWMSAQSA